MYNQTSHMRRTFFILVVAVAAFLMVGSIAAIDKAKKDTAAIKTKPSQADTSRGSNRPSVEKKRPDRNPSRSKYDDFIDLNGNGVDDRAEKHGSTKPKREPTTDSTSVKPPKK